MQTVATMLWRRLDVPGHDACRLERGDAGWQLDGAAAFGHEGGRHAQLHYRVCCDKRFHTQWGTVRGWIGNLAIDLSIRHTAQGWTLNDAPVAGLGHCIDLDLGFTPATNLLPVRRLHLQPGQGADAPAAWLDVDAQDLGVLDQRYECIGPGRCAYSAPRFGYRGELQVTADGFVSLYPSLWEAER